MKRCILTLTLALALTWPSAGFWGGSNDKDGNSGTWGKLVSGAKGTIKKFEEAGKECAPEWEDIRTSADEAIDQFAKDGKGFDIMHRATKKTRRKIQRLAADEDSALTGRFYDLKQPVNGRYPALRRETVVSFLKEFMEKDWDTRMLERYYSPDVKLSAPYFYLPRCKASYAPEAFQCNSGNQKRQVRPYDWVVVYTGRVTAPATGTYRFVGMGDDALAVRFNNELVLESGWSILTRNNMDLGTKKSYQNEIISPAVGRALYQYEETPHWNRALGGIASGTTFQVKEGKSYPISILISEIPGNEFGYCLLIEKIETEKPRRGIYAPDQSPVLQLFRTNATTPDLEEIEEKLKENGKDYTVRLPLEAPPFAKDSPIWKVTPDRNAESRNIVERAAASMSDEDTAMGRRVKDKKRNNKKTQKK